MSRKEIFWRVHLIVNQPNFSKASPVSEALAEEVKKSNPPLSALFPLDFSAVTDGEKKRILEAAGKTMEHRFGFFGEECCLGEKIRWLNDPLNGAPTPRKDFMNLNYRVLGEKASIMRIWWLSRHSHLIPLAQAWVLTGEEKYRQEIISQLEGWMEECQYPYGIVWCNAMEPAMRLLSWCFLFPMLVGRKPEGLPTDFLIRFLTCAKVHIDHVRFNRSRFSSANNHALAEIAALLCAQKTFPQLMPGEKANYAEMLSEEAYEQFSPNGVNREQAFSYQAFAMELLCAAACKSAEALELLRPLLAASSEFLGNAMEVCPLCGEYGDGDEAVATGLIFRDQDYYRNVLALARTLAAPSPVPAKSVSSPAQWYTGCCDAPEREAEAFSDYREQCGLFWNGTTGEGLEVSMFFRTGPLGYGGICAHAHADSLSILMAVNGHPVFIDSGTGNYHQSRPWRDYFRSTCAHTSLVADEMSQSVMDGPFLWRENFEARVGDARIDSDGFLFSAKHNGYMKRLNLSHRRSLEMKCETGMLELKDEVLECENVNVHQFFQVSPDLKVAKTGLKDVRIEGDGFAVTMTYYNAASIDIVRGDESKPLGFRSRHLGQREPITVIDCFSRCLGQDVLPVSIKIEKA